jgi:hypothetical protein
MGASDVTKNSKPVGQWHLSFSIIIITDILYPLDLDVENEHNSQSLTIAVNYAAYIRRSSRLAVLVVYKMNVNSDALCPDRDGILQTGT